MIPAEKEENLFDYSFSTPGSLPGTLDIPEDSPYPQINLIDYNPKKAKRFDNIIPEDSSFYLETESVSWVEVLGLGSQDVLKRLGQVFNLHPLVLEDIVNVPQRSKLEDYQDQVLIISQMVLPNEGEEGLLIEQVSFILSKHYLLSVQEQPEQDCFGQVRQRIRRNQGLIRNMGTDYLLYTLWDSIIDGYFPVLEDYGEHIEDLEDEVALNPTENTLNKIYQLKRELLALRRSIWPQRDAINALIRDGSPLIDPEVIRYFRDCYDHTVQIIDVIETYRELASGLMNVYLSAMSNKMNEIMQLLTVISTIFIPLTFIVGVYGMNFNPQASPLNMPELNWYWGYVVCWLVMISIAGGLSYFFWRRGWLNTFFAKKK